MSVDITEIELDPAAYAPRPDLFVRNLTGNTITFNMGRVKWQLDPKGSPNSHQVLPWTAAQSPGFERIWEARQVEVAVDPDFLYIIDELPTGGAIHRPYVHVQNVAQTVTDIRHDHNRPGPVSVAMFSLDGNTEYFNFSTYVLDRNTCRISTDDPITFIATVF